MKRFFTCFSAVVILLMFAALPMASMGQSKDSPVTVTWEASEQGYSNTQAVTSFVIAPNAIVGLFAKADGQTPPKYYNNSLGVRMYANNTLSITPLTGYSLNAIEYVFKKNSTYNKDCTLVTPDGTYTDGPELTQNNVESVGRWTYDGDCKNTVTIKLGGTGQRVVVRIVVTYTGSAGQTYTVSYDPQNGSAPIVDETQYAMGALVTVKSPSDLSISYEGHVFTKWSTTAAGSGTGNIDYLPGDQFAMGDGNVTLYAQWTSTQGTHIHDLTPTLVNPAMGDGTSYCDWTVTTEDQTTYFGKSYRSDNYIQMTNSQSGNSKHSGIVTNISSGYARNVLVAWNGETSVGRILNVYGKNTPYASTEELYSSATQGTLIGTLTKGTSSVSELAISADYNYIGLVSASGAQYFDRISITWVSGSTTTPTIVMGPSEINLGNVVINQPLSQTFVVSQANLSSAITLTATKGSLNHDCIEAESDPTQVEWTYTPNGGGHEFPVIITATSGTTNATLRISATVLPANNFVSLHESKAAYLVSPTTATDVKINLTDVEVVGQQGNYLYLQDGQAGVLVYGAGAPVFQKGYKFRQGYLLGTYIDYNGITEITDFSFVGYEGDVASLTTTEATVNAIMADPVTYESRYVQIENTTINNWTLLGNGSTLPFYDVFQTQYALRTAPDPSHNFTVKGMVNRHYVSNNGVGTVNVELAPTALTDITTTTPAAAPSFNPVGGTQSSAPVPTTFVVITPGSNAAAVYSLWLNGTQTVTDQRITSATTIGITGSTEIKVHGERDFYANSAEVDYWYNLPLGTHSISFSINGVVDPNNNVLVTSTLAQSQVPEVITYGDYGLAGWSTVPSSTTTINLSTHTFNDNATLYAVYYKGSSFTYNKVNSLSEITDGEYVIAASNGGAPYTFRNARATSSPAAEMVSGFVNINGSTLEGEQPAFENIGWIFSKNGQEYTIASKAYPQYWLFTANENTGVRVDEMTGVISWTITEDDLATGLFNMKCNRNNRYLALYSANGTPQDWRSYVNLNTGSSRIALYKKTPVAPTGNEPKYLRVFWNEDATADITIMGPSIIPSGYYLKMSDHGFANTTASNFVIEDGACFIPASGNVGIKATVKKNITGYGNNEALNGWYLLASPIGAVNPNVIGTTDAHVNNMVSGDYDLYGFDQTQQQEWQNNKVEGHAQAFGNQGGLLYASKTDRTIEFVGTVTAMPTAATGIPLTYQANASLAGWNLVGNPFTSPGYLVVSEGISDYYKLEEYTNANNQLESHLVAKTIDNAIDPMEGVFVQATGAGQTYYFKNYLRGNAPEAGMLNMTVRGENGKVVDVARVRFNNGTMMGKMMLNENGTKMYIPQGGKDYAVVRAQAQGELPINFKTRENGTFTLSFDTEAVEMSYLHLIDNMTGADIDLLATPSYTFEATPSDYASRFRLMFSASSISEEVDGDNAFAYFNGSNWMVSNIGEATLQVVDVMGRILSSETISGNAAVNLNHVPGVYMLRFVSGNDVKTQKVVVR